MIRRHKRCFPTDQHPAAAVASRHAGYLSIWRAVAAGVVCASLTVGVAGGQEVIGRSPIRVSCFDVYGTGERGIGPKNIQRCLASSPDFTFQTVNADDIRGEALAKFDVLVCPGGSGSQQSKTLDTEGRRAILNFVKKGGGYIGICAGAYLASSHYSWSLGILNARVVDSAHGRVARAMSRSR